MRPASARSVLETAGGRRWRVRETVLATAARRCWCGLDAVGGHDTTSNTVGKLRQAQAQAAVARRRRRAVMLSAPFDENPEPRAPRCAPSWRDNLKAIEAALAACRGTR
jgi:hypothetical protein